MEKIKIETEVSQSHFEALEKLSKQSGSNIPELVETIIVDWFHSLNSEQVRSSSGNSLEQARLIAYEAWKSAANAYRMYPDNKHTFDDYWENYGKPAQGGYSSTNTGSEKDENYIEGCSISLSSHGHTGLIKGHCSKCGHTQILKDVDEWEGKCGVSSEQVRSSVGNSLEELKWAFYEAMTEGWQYKDIHPMRYFPQWWGRMKKILSDKGYGDADAILIKLINMKKYKDSLGKTDYYLENQPTTWKEAFDWYESRLNNTPNPEPSVATESEMVNKINNHFKNMTTPIEYVYVPVSVKDELPEVDEYVTVIASKFGKHGAEGTQYFGWIESDKKWTVEAEGRELKDYDNNPDYWRITHWLKRVPITELLVDEAFLNWLDSAQASLEMEKGIHGKTERIRTRLSMLKEVRENYLRVNNKIK